MCIEGLQLVISFQNDKWDLTKHSLKNRSLDLMGLRILDLSVYCGTVHGRQKRTEEEVGAFLEEGCSCLPGGLMGSIPLRN